MARFVVYSDLHYEHGCRLQVPDSLRGNVDGVILAGDISPFPTAIKRARQISDALDAPAILIVGNHEFYGYVIEDVIEKLRSQADERVRFLECDSTEITGTRILGTTLWTDYQLNPEIHLRAMADMAYLISDFSEIKRVAKDGRKTKIDTDYILAEHYKCREWLSSELKKPYSGPTIAVTHTAPSRKSIVKHNSEKLIAASFASNLEPFIEEHDIDVWVHGHIHDSVDYMVGKTRVVSNPYGYHSMPREPNDEFISDFVVEV